jgi:hypothetical protein
MTRIGYAAFIRALKRGSSWREATRIAHQAERKGNGKK